MGTLDVIWLVLLIVAWRKIKSSIVMAMSRDAMSTGDSVVAIWSALSSDSVT